MGKEAGMDVGFIGLGDIGEPMAHAIADAGHRLHVWARRPEVLGSFADRGAVVHESPAALGRAVEHLGLCVIGEQDVRSVLFDHEALAECAPGTVVAIHSTIAPEACQRIADEAETKGAHVIDAPISGGRARAIDKTLLVMVGGADEAVARSMPVLHSYGSTVAHLGPVGAGQVVKVLNNLLMNANLTNAELVLRLGEALGLERAHLQELLLTGTARSFGLEALGTQFIVGQVSNTLGQKDLAIATGLIDRVADPELDLLRTVAAVANEMRDRMAP